jgi:hypothetical protein
MQVQVPEAQSKRFRISFPSIAATAQQPAAAFRPFAPVLETKEIEFQFSISLDRADFCFDGSKMPNLNSADWKPSLAIASWASWSRNDQTGKTTVTPDAFFACKEAAAVSCAGAATFNLQAEWSDSTESTAQITKKLKQKADVSGFEDQFIQITLYAAKQWAIANRKTPPLSNQVRSQCVTRSPRISCWARPSSST